MHTYLNEHNFLLFENCSTLACCCFSVRSKYKFRKNYCNISDCNYAHTPALSAAGHYPETEESFVMAHGSPRTVPVSQCVWPLHFCCYIWVRMCSRKMSSEPNSLQRRGWGGPSDCYHFLLSLLASDTWVHHALTECGS